MRKAISKGTCKLWRAGAAAAALALAALAAVSCGGEGQGTGSGTAAKLPPGTSAESLNQTSTSAVSSEGSSTASQAKSKTAATSYRAGATLEKVNFTLTKVTRAGNNSAVVSGSQRELAGDFLQIDLAINNASGGLVDLGNFSYRLYSPAIDASSHEEYYGSNSAYGGYVKKNTISAALLSASSLQKVSYVLRDGETVEDIFLFYDLNPLSVDANQAFSLEEAELIIYDTAAGQSASISLAGFAG
jgi:hypothetical protein